MISDELDFIFEDARSLLKTELGVVGLGLGLDTSNCGRDTIGFKLGSSACCGLRMLKGLDCKLG